MRLRWVVVLLIGVAFAAASLAAHAQGLFEKLVSPGPLSDKHAKYEDKCQSCHAPFARNSQSGLCLSCHKEVEADRNHRRGFHGRHPDASKSECRACHAEHKGRKADIVQLNRSLFNHATTNFALLGAHKRVACDGCHQPEKKFRATSSSCVDCHGKIDPHKGNLGRNCAGCHSEGGWRSTKPFDHSKTRFPLVLSHARVACDKCHMGERYKGLERTCVSCHGAEDKHGGRNGTKCETCHSPQTWRKTSFNHNTQTRFPLRGAHTKARCEGCHTPALAGAKPPGACSGCHSAIDPHEGKLGNACAQCHQETGWRNKVAFDHDLTKFPLIGHHATAPCEDCHKSASYKGAATACASCHKDTHHAGRLGDACAGCHTPNGWKLWRFDHTAQTSFPLTGAHTSLQCHACHRQASQKVSAPKVCIECHRADDAHQGAFGRACDKCHSTQSFRANVRPR